MTGAIMRKQARVPTRRLGVTLPALLAGVSGCSQLSGGQLPGDQPGSRIRGPGVPERVHGGRSFLFLSFRAGQLDTTYLREIQNEQAVRHDRLLRGRDAEPVDRQCRRVLRCGQLQLLSHCRLPARVLLHDLSH